MTLIKKFKTNNYEEIDRSINKKIEVLKLNTNRINKLRIEECEEFDLTNDYILESKSLVKDFEVDNLCGIIYRGENHVSNWIDQLDSTTKMYLINDNQINKIDDILRNPYNRDFPPVAMINEKYYIDQGDGKHRLTIAKCLGNKKATVIINKYIKSNIR